MSKGITSHLCNPRYLMQTTANKEIDVLKHCELMETITHTCIVELCYSVKHSPVMVSWPWVIGIISTYHFTLMVLQQNHYLSIYARAR